MNNDKPRTRENREQILALLLIYVDTKASGDLDRRRRRRRRFTEDLIIRSLFERTTILSKIPTATTRGALFFASSSSSPFYSFTINPLNFFFLFLTLFLLFDIYTAVAPVQLHLSSGPKVFGKRPASYRTIFLRDRCLQSANSIHQ